MREGRANEQMLREHAACLGNRLLRQGKALQAEPDVARPLTWEPVHCGPDGVRTTETCLNLKSANS